jgi:hypothetical protein
MIILNSHLDLIRRELTVRIVPNLEFPEAIPLKEQEINSKTWKLKLTTLDKLASLFKI